MERERKREKEERQKAGLDTADIDADYDEDYMGVDSIIEKLDKQKLKGESSELNRYEEATDSDSDDDERFSADKMNKQADQFEKKFKRHEELLEKFTKAGSNSVDLITCICHFCLRLFTGICTYRSILFM